jgi:uncharacterized protein YndB with AHSA1/START domain
VRPVSHTLIDFVSAPIVQVFALLTDLGCIVKWLPGCDSAESEGPLRKGARFRARFGQRMSEFEIVDFAPPATFGWVERGQRKGTRLYLRLDSSGSNTAVTLREVWTPHSFGAWVRGHLFERRKVQLRLRNILENLRSMVAPWSASRSILSGA